MLIIPSSFCGFRLDAALAKCWPEHSRARISAWLKAGDILVNGKILPPKTKIEGGEEVILHATFGVQQSDEPQAVSFTIIYEDDDILIINKPSGLVVHPGAGNRQGTLLNGLLYHLPDLAKVSRAGIVHRLDKDTTGLMVVAKTPTAHTALVSALSKREIEREYLALVGEELIAGTTIDAPIGRHPQQRTKMAVVGSGKPALTHTRCHVRYKGFTLLKVKLETGRTHQIRVHLSHLKTPIVGDSLYGWRFKVPEGSSSELRNMISSFPRQALHACSLRFVHPFSQKLLNFEAALPEDFANVLGLLQPK